VIVSLPVSVGVSFVGFDKLLCEIFNTDKDDLGSYETSPCPNLELRFCLLRCATTD